MEEEEEEEEEDSVKKEAESPDGLKRRRVRIVKRLVERPRSVYERFPTYEKNSVLDFTELFKGYTAPKSRLVKRPFQREHYIFLCGHPVLNLSQLKRIILARKKQLRTFSRVSLAIPEER